METPFALIVFIVVVLLIALLVILTRRKPDSSVYGGSNAAPVAPSKSRSKPPNLSEAGGYQPAPAEEVDFGSQEQSKDRHAEPPAVPPPPPLSSPAPVQAQPVMPAPQPAPAKPAPRRRARGLFDDEELEEAAPADASDEKKRDAAEKPKSTPVPRGGEPEPELVSDNLPKPGSPRQQEATPRGSDDDALTGLPEPKAEAPAIPTEDVRFTAYHPKEADVETWYTLLVYAHIEAALAKVQADAAKYKAEMGDTPRESRSSAGAQLARGTELTIQPQMDGVEFNPERVTFKWVEDMHRAEFRMKAGKDLAGLAGNGTISIFVGPLIVATIRFGMLFNEKSNIVVDRTAMTASPTAPSTPMESSTATLYKADQIFVSYSHKDSPVVLACRDAYKALGYDVLIDVDNLRSGEKWNDALMRMIDRADIFQLFWSKNSAESKYCKQEWEYALKKGKEAFIRPVYWEQPLVSPPDDLNELHFAYVPLAKKDQ